MTLIAEDPVLRALQLAADPEAVRRWQASRDGFLELLLQLADAEDEPVVIVQAEDPEV